MNGIHDNILNRKGGVQIPLSKIQYLIITLVKPFTKDTLKRLLEMALELIPYPHLIIVV